MEYDSQFSPEDNKETDILLPVAKYNISKWAKLKGGTRQPYVIQLLHGYPLCAWIIRVVFMKY